MSSHEWREVYRMIRKMDRTLQPAKRRPVYSDVLIVAMYLWSVAHDRPQLWACDRQNYHRTWLPKLLPSQSRFNRRLRSPRCQALLAGVLRASIPQADADALCFLDGRPLVVGACSKDEPAHRGGDMAKPRWVDSSPTQDNQSVLRAALQLRRRFGALARVGADGGSRDSVAHRKDSPVSPSPEPQNTSGLTSENA